MARIPIPKNLEAEVLFKSDHACAICQKDNIQTHHIDGNPSNNEPDNLVVLCLAHHDKASSRSPISKGFTPLELKKYRTDWEDSVKRRRDSLSTPLESRLVRFDGENTNDVFLEVEENHLRRFRDSDTFQFLGFNWGNVDIYLDEDKKKFTIEESLTRLKNCRKIRVKFRNGTFANEIYIVWDDGRKHHVPDAETMEALGGFSNIDSMDYQEFNTIPHGKPIVDIFTVRTRKLLQQSIKKGLLDQEA